MARLLRSTFAIALALVAACRGSSDEDAASPLPGAPAGPTRGTTALAFDSSDTLELGPTETTPLAVSVSPPSAALVRFALLGDRGDASLDDSAVVAGDDGVARTTLHASSRTATFRVRASVDGGPSAERAVAVSGDGFATLVVSPSYDGRRTVGAWIATAAAGDTCSSHPERPVADGPIVALGVPGASLVLDGVPVQPSLLVTVRGDRAITGCLDVTGLGVNERRTVTIQTTNVPAAIASSSFGLELGAADAGGLAKVVSAWGARFFAAYLGGRAAPTDSTPGPSALLDAMASTLPPPEAATFEANRHDGAWDEILAKHGVGDPSTLVDAWLPSASTKLVANPGSIRAVLAVDAGGAATLATSHLLALDDDFPTKPVTFHVDADDLAQATGTVAFSPSRLLASAIESAALLAVGGAKDVGSAIATVVRCDAVAKTLLPSVKGFAGCDAACLEQLCAAGIAAMWTRARDADDVAGKEGVLDFAASGPVTVDQDAKLTAFAGTWVGGITDAGGAKADLKGDAKLGPPPAAPGPP